MSLVRLCEWLASTSWSIALHESRYVFLIVLATHVLTLTVFVGTAVMVDLRLLGVTLTRVPVSEVVTRLGRWSRAGFFVMITTGSLLFYAAPTARYENLFFRAKMTALVLAIANVWVFDRRVYSTVAGWDTDPVPPRAARRAAAVSLVLWGFIITAGRMIPYQQYWFG